MSALQDLPTPNLCDAEAARQVGLAIWRDWVRHYCRGRAEAESSAVEWVALERDWAPGKSPLDSAESLVALRERAAEFVMSQADRLPRG